MTGLRDNRQIDVRGLRDTMRGMQSGHEARLNSLPSVFLSGLSYQYLQRPSDLSLGLGLGFAVLLHASLYVSWSSAKLSKLTLESHSSVPCHLTDGMPDVGKGLHVLSCSF